ncbi:MAG: histidine kinase [Mediterranea sp.]|jgi:sensor histidine kinase YesM|nr:histidine kinase [Mediterranea sp.]
MKKHNLFYLPPNLLEIATHIIAWGIIYAFPFYFMEREIDQDHNITFLLHFVVPVALTIVFYTNYFMLIPRYLFKQRSHEFFLYNLALLIVLGAWLQTWQNLVTPPLFPPAAALRYPPPPHGLLFTRDMLSLVFAIILSIAIRMNRRWSESEVALQEAERRRVEAELRNLRNQVNPHFMLNTLNNIYALVQFDTSKAQQAIQELSKLLRYVLSDNQENFVPLCKEVDLVRNYIGLMSIRFSESVKLTTSFDVRPNSQTPVAPLIFISLIENAFKHGISPTKPSYIRIRLSEDEEVVHCEIHNSNHPKPMTDKSGSGIGLEQVQHRLDLLYPHAYTWEKGVTPDGAEYMSRLSIKYRELTTLKSSKI